MDKAVILLLCPTDRDESYASFIEALPERVLDAFNFRVANRGEGRDGLDLVKYVKTCEDIVERENIDQVICFTDVGASVKAALVDKYSHLRGPSIESVGLAIHKYYTRQELESPEVSLKHTVVDVDTIPEGHLSDVFDIVGMPAFFKPCTGTASFGVSEIKTLRDLYEQITQCRNVIGNRHLFEPFFCRYLNLRDYPLFAHNCAIIEELVKGAKTLTVDGFVFKRQILHRAIFENVYWKSHPSAFMGVVYPPSSDVSGETETRLWNVFDLVVGKAVEKGFDNQFIDVEVFLKPNGDVKVMEVNPRMFSQAIPLYRMCLEDGDPLVVTLDSNVGKQPKPCSWNGYHGINGYVITFGSGKVEELFDFEEAKKMPGDVLPRFSPGDVIGLSGAEGCNLAFVNIREKCRKDMLKRYLDVCKKLLKKKRVQS
ncbi:uncharacterized protein [Ptychodera flava]|uniref:uncharacterized protein isoform X2 n=1 Tax=Ptychodera flava TaxID=63121 RepID=UPI00396A745C